MKPTKATLRAIAEQAGVHPATVSRAFNERTRHLVAAQTVERVLSLAEVLDYRPNQFARGLKTQRSATIGVVIPDLTNPLFPPIVRGIEDLLGAEGYVALIANTDNDSHREQRVLQEMRARNVDGLIVATARRRSQNLVDLDRNGLPIVLVNRVIDGNPLSSVHVDDKDGIRRALDHLLSLGHRDIAHIAGPQGLSTGYRRYRAYLQGMRATGLDPNSKRVAFASSFSEAEGFRCAEELFAYRKRPTAILTGNDLLALGALRSMRSRGIECPAKCSLVGFNDMPFVDLVAPPLTTVRLPQYEAGFQAAQLLLDRLEEMEAKVNTVTLLPELVIRESSAPRL